MERSKRNVRPSMEGLEGRALLNGSKVHSVHARATAATNASLDYATADGAKVHIQLKGPGNLAGSQVVGGVLNLVFSATTTASVITGTVKGGSGFAALGTITNANVPITSQTGLGGELIGAIRLPSFNLVPGGAINLLPGVNELTLNSVGPNTQVRLRDTPLNTTTISGFLANTNNNNNSFNSSLTSIGTVTTSNLAARGAGTLEPVATGFGGANVGALNGAIAAIPTVGNGQNAQGTPGLSQSTVNAGRSLTYAVDSVNGVTLSSIAGTFLPGPNLIEPRDASIPGPPVPPPGVIVAIKHVGGGPTALTPPLGDAQIYGYDAAANALIRFDAVTGAQLQSTPVPASAAGVGGVTLARPGGGRLTALVGIGTNVFAYDASTGAPVGGFSIASLAAEGFTGVTGLATGAGSTVVVDANDGPDGTIQAIDVARSLATGQAVAVGSPFSPGREFVLSGGIAGVPGYPSFYAPGGAHFDTFSPNVTQAGVLTVSPANGKLSESARTALTSQGNFVPANANGTVVGNASRAIGSIDSLLALDAGVRNGVNVLSLLTPNGLATSASVSLADANPLAGLSQSFHPELVNAALVDVQGNVQSFTAQDATGLVLNDAGNLDQLTIGRAVNSSIIGLPFSHVNIGTRTNVSIVTSSRLVGNRGDVIVNPSARQVGPLSLP